MTVRTTRLVHYLTGLKDGTHGTFERAAEGVPLLSAKNVWPSGVSVGDESLISVADATAILSNGYPKRGDVLLTIVGTVGRTAIYDRVDPLPFQRSVAFLRPRADLDARFLRYQLESRSLQDQISLRTKTSAQPGLYLGEVASLQIAVPGLELQRAIVDFLDRETAHIDTLIAKQEQLASKLRERRRALVTLAVTRGLRSASTVETTDRMLGPVPNGWSVMPLGRAMQSLDSLRVPLSADERGERQGGFPYYGASGVIDSVDGYLFDESLVLVSEDGANLLARSTPIAFVAHGRYWVNNHAHVLRPRMGPPEYWAARIEAIDISPVVTGSAQPKLTAEALRALRVAVPAESEMVEIMDRINRETRGIDRLGAKAREFISLAKERRAALITAAVTGQIDVAAA